MEKDERLKLVGENGETVLMAKDEYLKLAKQKDWRIEIPRLKNGTYNCDVFGGDDVRFNFGFAITGTLYLKDNARLDGDVFADKGIILGHNAFTHRLVADNGDVIVGNDVSTCDITGRNVICGDNLEAGWYSVSATNGFVIFGKNVSAVVNDDYYDDDDYGISATEDIICDDEPSVESN